MHACIIHAHPEEQSFSSALAKTAQETFESSGAEAKLIDLHKDQFDPVSTRKNFKTVANADYFKPQAEELHAVENNGFADDIAGYQQDIEKADLLILNFPLWWFSMPAILKGWVDRVMAMGFAYGGGRWYGNGPFKDKHAMLCITTGGPETMYQATGLNGDIAQILFPINHGILAFTGFTVLQPHIVWGPARLSPEQRREELHQWSAILADIANREQIAYPPLSAYDDTFQLKHSQ